MSQVYCIHGRYFCVVAILLGFSVVYYFPGASWTIYHALGGLKTTETYSLTALRARSQNSGCWQAALQGKAIGENPSLALLASGGSRYSLACDSIFQPLPLSLHCLFALCLWVSNLSLAFALKDPDMVCWAHLKSRVILSWDPHLNYICKGPSSE